MNRTLAAFARHCGGTLVGEDRPVAAVSTDSRSIGPGDLFVALRGPRFDGAAFMAQCRAAGAAGGGGAATSGAGAEATGGGLLQGRSSGGHGVAGLRCRPLWPS